MILLIFSYGYSTTHLPNQVRVIKRNIKKNTTTFLKGLNFIALKFFLNFICKKKIAIDIIKATTPPNLLGILRKIA